ncbi:ribonuclease R [Polynucleobacter paneuropaeus]|uniref:Ribonuclease R n=1 Tax=Polynucleobacter paneuropaeus TaxID=2527775 RepID=A0A2Z4JSW1_9BURK|nr:ribonuclease R [Polynucleobacter paneuropaeus]AWW49877.1 ribonuclease R [Polynucleobacter paneuropaeus]
MRKADHVVPRDDNRLGTVQGHRDGFGFVIPDDGGEDIFLSEKEMSRVMHGDRVNVKVLGTDRRGRPEGQIVEVVVHANKLVIGRLLNENGVLIVAPEDKRIGHDILIPPKGQGIAKLGQVVSVEIIDYPDSYRQAVGRVVEVLGEIDDPGMEIEIAVRKYGVPHEFSAAAMKEAAALPDTVQQSDLEGRVDLRDVPLVTIDGADARDFDDAVYAEPVMYGKSKAWRLIVAIADVSHYVKPGHPLDDDGLLRATSVYFPRRVIPMLPEKISNGLCSLNPGVDRLCMVCDSVVDNNGIVLAYQFYPAVMHSAQRFTYDIVWEILSNSKGPEAARFAEFRPLLMNLYSLFKILLSAREKRGAIEFETTETQIISNELGKIMRIEPRTRNDAHRLIEECMLTANVCAADFIEKNKHLGLYRVHGEPSEEKLVTLRQVLRTSGLSLGGGEKPKPRDFAKLIKEVKERPDANMLQSVVLRSMQQAMYQPDNEGHFGLAYPAYSHFTSPIRRYPDLLTHRVIKAILQKKPYIPVLPPKVPLNLTLPRKGKARQNAVDAKKSHTDAKTAAEKGTKLPKGANAALPIWGQLGVHCSSNERRADEASRDVEAWLKCYYMRDHLGQEYAGTVTSVASFGLFIQLENLFVEGMVHVTELGGDYFQYDEARQELRGERTGIRYRLGDRMHVLVSRVDLDARKIEFSLMKAVGAEPGNNFNRRSMVLATETGRPNKKAASKKSRPQSKTPQKPSGINVNAAKTSGNLGASQSKGKSNRNNGKNGKAKAANPGRMPGKAAGSKPPVRNTKARRK